MAWFRWMRESGWRRGSRRRRGDGNGHLPNAHAVAVPDLRTALPQIFVEFQRARRYERTLTVAVFSRQEGERSERAGSGSGDEAGTMPAALAATLRQAMRETDLVAWEPRRGRCVIVMPEIGIAEARRAVERMRNLCASRLAHGVRADVAQFPEDGWTFDELLAVAPRRGRAKDRHPRGRPARTQPEEAVTVGTAE